MEACSAAATSPIAAPRLPLSTPARFIFTPPPSLFLKPMPTSHSRLLHLLPAAHSLPSTSGDSLVQTIPEAPKSLDSVEIFNLDGESLPVSDLWKNRRVVIGFTRHFGCVLCMKRADLLASRKEEIAEANASLIIIGPGKVEQARAFAQNMKFPGEVYADPDFRTHRAFEFLSGVRSTISLTTGLRIISAYQEGYRQDWNLSSDKDTVSKGGWQQGGVLVAGPGTENIIYLFKDVQAGDEPDMDDIVAACQK